MPEGDTVRRSARALDRALRGKTLIRTDFRVPQLATTDLVGRVIDGVESRGKHMLTRFDDGWTLHTHFKMEGSWHLYRQGERWRGPGWQVRAVLETEPFVAVGFRLAIVELVPTEHEDKAVGHLGPDILSPDWDSEEAASRVRSVPQLQIGEALFDQRNVSGIGNLYVNETLYLKGVHPDSKVDDVSDIEGILDLARRLMEPNVEYDVQTTTGSRRRSEVHWVFERPGHLCRRCNAPIQVSRQGRYDRLVYWCPTCQPQV